MVAAFSDFIARDRRSGNRARLRINGRFFIKGINTKYEDCRIINISKTGIAFKTVTQSLDLKTKGRHTEKISVSNFDVSGLRNKTVCLEAYPAIGSLNTFTLHGEIKRVAKYNGSVYIAIHFNTVLDTTNYLKFIAEEREKGSPKV